MFTRILTKIVTDGFKDGFVSVIYGPRRVGKTVLLDQIKQVLSSYKILTFNGDTQEARDILSTTSETRLTGLVKDCDVLMIDEAQRIKNIGLSLKILIDKFPKLKIIATGSATLDLSRGVRETLTGRTITYKLFPFSVGELAITKYVLPDSLIYGGYPYIQSLSSNTEKQQYLENLVDDYLLKDLFDLKQVGDIDIPRKLLSLLAYQIGNQVSLSELARQLSVGVKTVARYLTLLEKIFIIFPLGTYSTNLRSELSRSKKYYFYDLGIRNAIIKQFGVLEGRTDTGPLWENLMILERAKKHEYQKESTDMFFWRNYAQNEVDLIEKDGQLLSVFEFKWSSRKLAKTPKAFRDTYKTEVKTINTDNFEEFV